MVMILARVQKIVTNFTAKISYNDLIYIFTYLIRYTCLLNNNKHTKTQAYTMKAL